jgi:hypothetical protein
MSRSTGPDDHEYVSPTAPAPDDRRPAGGPDEGPRTLSVGAPEVTDEVLVQRALEHDRWAEAALYRRHVDALTRTALHVLGNVADAEDVVQEAFAIALSRLSGLRRGASFRGWLGVELGLRAEATLAYPEPHSPTAVKPGRRLTGSGGAVVRTTFRWRRTRPFAELDVGAQLEDLTVQTSMPGPVPPPTDGQAHLLEGWYLTVRLGLAFE